MITADDFRALARSSPWRCTRAHFTWRAVGDLDVEAWLERPGTLTTRTEDRAERWVNNRPADIRVGALRASNRLLSEGYTDEEFVGSYLELPMSWVRDVTPITRDDGLVLVRPDDADWPEATRDHLEADDPMYGNYRWVAMLDPYELARGVELGEVRQVSHHGRTAWAARCVPTTGYDPRCGCCELLWSELSVRAEAEAGGPDPDPDDVYPEAYDVVLDHATGFVVAITPVGATTRDDLAFDVEIHSAS